MASLNIFKISLMLNRRLSAVAQRSTSSKCEYTGLSNLQILVGLHTGHDHATKAVFGQKNGSPMS
jgi:hypothetical protein